MFVNEYEFELVLKMTGMQKAEILENLEFMVVTLGEKGAVVYNGAETYPVAPVAPKQIIDPTGAGDAFRGGFLTGYSYGWDFQTCAQMGALSATYCLESDGPQGQGYQIEEYVARYRETYNDHGLFDILIARNQNR